MAIDNNIGISTQKTRLPYRISRCEALYFWVPRPTAMKMRRANSTLVMPLTACLVMVTVVLPRGTSITPW